MLVKKALFSSIYNLMALNQYLFKLIKNETDKNQHQKILSK